MTALNRGISYEEEYSNIQDYCIPSLDDKTHLLHFQSQLWEDRDQIAAYFQQLETLKTKRALQAKSVGKSVQFTQNSNDFGE